MRMSLWTTRVTRLVRRQHSTAPAEQHSILSTALGTASQANGHSNPRGARRARESERGRERETRREKGVGSVISLSDCAPHADTESSDKMH